MSAAGSAAAAPERWPLGYGMWLRAVCAILGMGEVGREAMAGMLFEAYAAGASPIAAAMCMLARLERENGTGAKTDSERKTQQWDGTTATAGTCDGH